MNNLKPENFRDFFVQTNILTKEEFDQISNLCDFYLKMPDRNSNKVIISITTKAVLPTAIYKKLSNHNKPDLIIDIESKDLTQDYSKANEYITEWVTKNYPQEIRLRELLQSNNYRIEKRILIVKYLNRNDMEDLKKIEKELLFFLRRAHFDVTALAFELDINKQTTIANAAREREVALEAAKKLEASRVIDKNKQYAALYKVTGKFTKISDITKDDVKDDIKTIVKLCGEITFVEKKPARKNENVFIYKWNIYDHENGAIQIKYILNTTPSPQDAWRYKGKYKRLQPMPEAYVDSFKKGDWVNVEGFLQCSQLDNFQITVMINKMVKVNTPERLLPIDNCENKRVELLIHSNMTAYDGLDDPSKIFKYAKGLGHKAIAVIERENVQSIPGIFSASKETGIKPIYGCEFEVIEKIIPVAVNPVNRPILTSEYIVFDIETTGLYPETEDLLEFGAIRYKDGQIVERLDFFAKPTKELTTVAINMSHITPDMVKDGVSQKEALKKIKEWIGDTVLIAHNGIRFDIMFLNKLCEKYGLSPITNCLIDTLEISHAINKEYAKHNLGFLTRKLKSDYNETEAHRADKDSEYLLKVWQYFMKRLVDMGITTIDQITPKLQTASLRANRHGYFIDVYVKTQPGIKALYKLVSLSLTERLFQRDDDEPVHYLSNGVPKLYFEDLLQYRQDLIICNHPYDGEVWESALCDPLPKLKEKICKYDYVFVAPGKNIGYLVAQEKISKRDINKVLAKIIDTTKSLGKKVCAVSDAYYTNPDEKTIHEIYVYTKQLGGKRHWLYRHDDSTFVPDLHYLTTQEMLDEFAFLKDETLAKEIVIDNTNDFADKVEKTIPITDKPHNPKIPNSKELLTNEVWFNAKRIYGDQVPPDIQNRINAELNGICSKGYDVIYWICHKLVKKSNEDGYIVGSRGSVGSSIIAFFSKISEVNPLPPHYICPDCHHYEIYEDDSVDGFDLPPKKCPICGKEMYRDGHNIPFSTFLGINADKTPDIDLNFSGEYQAEAHKFIRDMFDEKHAYRAGTVATTADKMAYGYVKSYFEQAKPEFVPTEPLITALAARTAGVKRTTGQHPGGIVVLPLDEEITDFTPYSYPSNDKTKDWFTTHFEYHSIEKNLLKFDILGHDEPTILKHLKDATGIDPVTIPNFDDKVLELFADSKGLGIKDENYDQEKLATMALPEFGTTVTRGIVRETKPTGVGDLIRISGLSHGTNVWQNNAQDLIRQGIQLKQVVACREDIIAYLSKCGVEPATAFAITEKIRKGKGLSPEHEKLLIEKNVPKWYIGSCKKIEYLFPKAHATAYVLDAIRTAWYKVYYPTQFYAVWFSTRSDVFDIETVVKGPVETEAVMKKYIAIKKNRNSEEKLSNKQEDLIPIFEVCLEMFARGIRMLNIDINKSQATEFIAEGDTILPPFSSIDGLGVEVAKSIVEARKVKPFSSIADLQERTRLSTTLIEKLKNLHVLDNLEPDDQMRLF